MFRFELKDGVKVGEPFVVGAHEKCHCSSEEVLVANSMLIEADYVTLEKRCSNCNVIEYSGTTIVIGNELHS